MKTTVQGEGNKVLILETHDSRGLVSLWIKSGWEIIVAGEKIRGFADGHYKGTSCGTGKTGERWGDNNGKPRKMQIETVDGKCRIQIHTPTGSSGDTITIDREALGKAAVDVGLGPMK